jgi:hypothetical protein
MADYYYKSRFQIQAGLVLLLVDDFTDRPADEKLFRVTSRHSLKVIKKQGGVLVFINPPKEACEITIESPYYLSRIVSIQQGETCEVKMLRMIPGTGYPESMGRTFVTGYAQPGSAVFLACDTGERFLHLKDDYSPDDGERIKLYCREPAELTGKQICICSEDGAERCCLVTGLNEDGGCRLDRALSGTYPKVRTKVFPVYEGRTDDTGWYRIPVKEPVKRLLGWNRNDDGSENYKEYTDGRQDGRIDFSFL